jgi:hypothetical protein
MADVFLNLIDPLEERFNHKDKSDRDIEVARRDMVEAFKHHPVELLQAVVRWIVLHRKFSTMPTVGDIHDVFERIIAERKAAEAKPRTKLTPGTLEAFQEGLRIEKEAAQAWAREWLKRSPLGQESLRDGWCRPLFHMAWQIKLGRTRSGKPCDDLMLDDFVTADPSNRRGRGLDLIEGFRRNSGSGLGPKFERAIVLQEKLA